MVSDNHAIESAIEALGEVPESMVAIQVDTFLTARDNFVDAGRHYKQAFTGSSFLLKIESDAIADPALREKLKVVHSLYRGDGGA